MKTIEYLNKITPHLSPYERKKFQKHLPLFFKYFSMHEFWIKIDNIDILLDIATREGLVNKEKLFKFCIAICERYSYKIFDIDLHGFLIQESKKCFKINTRQNQIIVSNAIRKTDDFCLGLRTKYNIIEQDSKEEFNYVASYKIPTIEDVQRLNDAQEQIRELSQKYNILKAAKMTACFCFDSTLEDEIKGVYSIIEMMHDVSFYFNSEICHLFRDIVQNPFEAQYAPTTFREWFDRNVCDRYHKHFFRPLYQSHDL